MQKCAHISSCATNERSGLEGRRHEAEAVTAGDADGGTRDAADPATGGIPTEPGDGRPRRIRTRRPAGIRRSRKCAGAKRREDSAKPNPKGAQASAGEDAARRPPPRAGEVAAAFPAP